MSRPAPPSAHASRSDGARAAPEPSKTQRKRAMHALQDLGERLVKMPESVVAGLPLPEALREAVDLARRIRDREGRRRQLQYIGRVMRDIDAQPLIDAIARLDSIGSEQNARFHAAERWRERLLAEPGALEAWLAGRPGRDDDVPALQRLVEAARAERASGQPGRSFRELFRHVRDALERSTDPTDATP